MCPCIQQVTNAQGIAWAVCFSAPTRICSAPQVIKEVIKAYSYVLLWMSISCSVIMFNKWVLAYSGFPFPLALTLWHMVFCSTVGFLAVRVFKSVKSHNMSVREYCNRVLPIGKILRTVHSPPAPPLHARTVRMPAR
jgi:hypothetical protein